MNASFALVALVPPPAVTVTSTVPTEAAGAVAVRDDALPTENVAGVAPNFTALTPMKLVPVTVTVVPPVVGPEFGFTPVTVGAGGGGPAVMDTFWT